MFFCERIPNDTNCLQFIPNPWLQVKRKGFFFLSVRERVEKTFEMVDTIYGKRMNNFTNNRMGS